MFPIFIESLSDTRTVLAQATAPNQIPDDRHGTFVLSLPNL